MKFSSKLALMSLGGLAILIFTSRIIHGPEDLKLISPLGNGMLVSNFKNVIKEAILGSNYDDSKLSPIVKNSLDNENGDYSIVIEELENTQTGIAFDKYYLNEHKKMYSASLYKLFLLAAVFRQIKEGKLAEDQVISSTKTYLTERAGGLEPGYEEKSETIEYKVSQALVRVSTISDNFSAIMLAEKIGWDKLQQEADIIGAKSTVIKSPITTTASDITIFLRKLYRKEIVSVESSEKIIELLSKAQINDRIPARLPKSAKIAHKTGELSRLRHDAGIIFLDSRPYLIVLMSENLKDENVGVETLADVSKSIFDYFASK